MFRKDKFIKFGVYIKSFSIFVYVVILNSFQDLIRKIPDAEINSA